MKKDPQKSIREDILRNFLLIYRTASLLGKAIAVLEISIYLSGNENFTEKTKKVNERRAVLLFYISSM